MTNGLGLETDRPKMCFRVAISQLFFYAHIEKIGVRWVAAGSGEGRGDLGAELGLPSNNTIGLALWRCEAVEYP